jgi:hypothetical protein
MLDGGQLVLVLTSFCPPEIRQAAFAAVLQGVHMGAYDERMVG